MKFTAVIVTFLAIVRATQAGNPQNAIQLSASAQADAEVEVETPTPTPAATTFEDIPTPAPTNFSDPTPAPTFPTAAPTASADETTIEDAAPLELRSSASTVGVVGVAYNSEGTVGEAYATTRAEYEARNSSTDDSNGATVPIVVVGCLVGVLGMVAAVVVARKRKAAVEEEEGTDYSNAVHTPVSVKAEDAYASTIRTPAAGEAGEVDYSDAIHTPAATV